jgi:UDP-GlcNAc:undecaprenyl-phosphate GlcNAc-1-phosphate transferase
LTALAAFKVIFISALLALVLGPLTYWLTLKLKLLDTPGTAPHKIHDTPMPVAGGIVLFICIFTVSHFVIGLKTEPMQAILLGSFIVFLFGLWDDIKDLSPLWKLTGQILATVLMVWMGIQIRLFVSNGLNYALTLLWMVGVTNAFNFVDSMDGLALGLAAMAAAFFMLVTVDANQDTLALFSAILVGACLGSFYYNSAPARFFLGDSGSQLLGFLLAALAIAYNPVGYTRLTSWFVPILLVGVPIFDTTLVVISRLRGGRPIYKAGRDHTYHRLVLLGMSPNRAVLTMHVVALLAGCLAFIALDMPPLVANLIFITVFLGALAALWYLDFKNEWQ